MVAGQVACCGTTPPGADRCRRHPRARWRVRLPGDADGAVDRSARGRDGAATVARIPASLAEPAFATRRGARFLAETMVPERQVLPATDVPTYSSVDELIEREPLLVDPDTAVGEVARRMTDRSVPAVVRLGSRAVRAGHGRGAARAGPGRRPAARPRRRAEIMDTAAPVVSLGDTAAEALMLLLERDAEFLLVTDRAGELRGVVCPATSPSRRSPSGSPCTSSCAGPRASRSWPRSPARSRRCSASCCRAGWPPAR